MWKVGSGECVSTLEGHSDWVRSVAFSHDSTLLASASDDHTVRVWRMGSGECLHTVNVERAMYRISFDSSGKHLYTDSGLVDISTLSTSAPASISAETQTAQYQHVALSATGIWITYNSENLLRLPSEYRPSCSAVSGNVIAMGTGNGRVWTCEVQSSVS
ncbi:WD40 repeat-like protein [Polyplosphaeria fusca]|uniref:Mitochondrial division protein 1 n=1 Tax=Polyplosphaeria fusca TaxID=682080 RepID=A0A9P4R0I7_9PLEO|nr:WD40 repeat-like protein [Polyplosphaeria fusca]